MKVFKFGGASVRDAGGVKNVLKVLEGEGINEKLIVISAMGKTTNALEEVVKDYLQKGQFNDALQPVKEYHREILLGLFENKDHIAFAQVRDIFQELENFLNHNRSTNYDFVYDQVVIYGELLSTNIVSTYFSSRGIKNDLLDARNCIRTDSTYRDAQVQWDETQAQIKLKVNPKSLTITQGFIGGDPNNFSTTLGREGSDYTAGIFAYCLNADSVTIWKDVPGVLNADPRAFENPHLLEQISYEEAIELAFYGASVIHPKTLQPLQRKEIPLFVKSFLNPGNPGTAVRKGQPILPKIPCFIVKKDQVLISLSSLDFSFILEKNISEIFSLFHKYQIKVDLIQNSAISFSVCIDNKFNNLEKLINHLKATFRVSYNTGVSLYTIRHFDEKAVEALEKDKKILLKQTTRETVQLVAIP
ncbi:aspartate kinase [Salinimicrobium sediminilitoris]|uniref:aspartate kinase n=1 Tax=Salinimicrobium sediminilitoris TaxID=2876715 RepID=UPI001E3CECE7|nr:aspartate kinase [Salinimicrobium sediminilitoris]MCC8359718.1 aspartate kinase [Salinimicrobium sediminilitoris]